jgi:hypothetical protein
MSGDSSGYIAKGEKTKKEDKEEETNEKKNKNELRLCRRRG